MFYLEHFIALVVQLLIARSQVFPCPHSFPKFELPLLTCVLTSVGRLCVALHVAPSSQTPKPPPHERHSAHSIAPRRSAERFVSNCPAEWPVVILSWRSRPSRATTKSQEEQNKGASFLSPLVCRMQVWHNRIL